MSTNKNKKSISIGEAAETLGVSIDTVRRWDKKGKLNSSRADNNARLFSLDEIRSLANKKEYSISEAANKLNLSADTLRRLEDRGMINPKRNKRGHRIYTQKILNDFRDTKYYINREGKKSISNGQDTVDIEVSLRGNKRTAKLFDLNVKLDSSNNRIRVGDIVLTYDPAGNPSQRGDGNND